MEFVLLIPLPISLSSMEVMSVNLLSLKKVKSLLMILLQKSRKEPNSKSIIPKKISINLWMRIRKRLTLISKPQLMI
jgi:hypothetical protein